MSKESKEQKYLRERNESNEKLATANTQIELLTRQLCDKEIECSNLYATFSSMAKAVRNTVSIYETGTVQL